MSAVCDIKLVAGQATKPIATPHAIDGNCRGCRGWETGPAVKTASLRVRQKLCIRWSFLGYTEVHSLVEHAITPESGLESTVISQRLVPPQPESYEFHSGGSSATLLYSARMLKPPPPYHCMLPPGV